jgi:hypothetical protein
MTCFLRNAFLALVAFATLAIIVMMAMTAEAAEAKDAKPAAETAASADTARQIVVEEKAKPSNTVTPAKAALPPATAGISTVDVVAVQRHFLVLGTPLSGCRLTAADVNGDTAVDTIDAVAIQRFYLGETTGIANTGKYQFIPANRTYQAVGSNQTGQDYDTLVLGDVAPGL